MPKHKHIAISVDDIFDWCRKNNIDIVEGCKECFSKLNKVMQAQIKSSIPIITIYLLSEDADKIQNFVSFCDCAADFFYELCMNPRIIEKKIKISIFGKWYNMPSRLIESLKKAIDETKENDDFFANFCINYDGQEEIVDACKLIAKQVQLGKIDHEMITKETVKENIYSSYFIPPDVYLIYGERKWTGLLLWDSPKSRIIFAGKSFMEFEESDFEKC